MELDAILQYLTGMNKNNGYFYMDKLTQYRQLVKHFLLKYTN